MNDPTQLLVDDTKFLSHYLFLPNTSEYLGLLETILEESSPIPDSLWDRVVHLHKRTRARHSNPVRTLETLEAMSPILLHRDLASIALFRLGYFSQKRSDTLAGLLVYDLDGPEFWLCIEAAFAICHWRNFGRPMSRWFESKRFIEIAQKALLLQPCSSFAAYALIWSLAPGQDFTLEPGYPQFVELLRPLLMGGASGSELREVHIACQMALGELAPDAALQNPSLEL